MDNKAIKDMEKIMETAYGNIKEMLHTIFPNLYFYISPIGTLSCWVRTSRGGGGCGIELKYKINVGQILYYQWEYLIDLNEKVTPVVQEPDKYFYCVECDRVLPRAELEDNVFAGYYCKECAKKPEIAKLIAQSKERGFYD